MLKDDWLMYFSGFKIVIIGINKCVDWERWKKERDREKRK